MTREAHMHRPQSLSVGGYDLLTATLALVSTHRNLKLERKEARNQEYHADPKYRDELPYPLGYKKSYYEEPAEQSYNTDDHNDTHRGPNSSAFML